MAGVAVSALKLGPRGRRLYEKMIPGVSDPVQIELLVEACRICDQLETMDEMLRGDASSWSVVKMPRGGGNLYLEVDQLVATRRQLQLALKQITTALTVAGEGAGSSTGDAADELTKRRNARLDQKRDGAATGG